MKIFGAVLEEIGREKPYANSKPISISELELAGPGPDELLVKMEAAGICHSDLSVVDGNRVRQTPMLLGHEAAGRVIEVGPGAEEFKVGQRVTMAFLPRCGECRGCATDGQLPCEPGTLANNSGVLLGDRILLDRDGEQVYHHLGVSGFATHAVVNKRSCVALADDIPSDIAAVLGCAVLTGGGAVLNAGKPKEGDTVAVVGLGGVGMAALLTALSLELGPVVGIDALPEKLARATELGATEVMTPQEALDAGFKAPVVIEAAGNARAFETAVKVTGPGGITVTVGLPAPTAMAEIMPLGLTAEARSIAGSYLGSAVPSRDIPTYAQLWREGKLPVEALISKRIKLSEINEAMDELAAGRAVRQVIMFEE